MKPAFIAVGAVAALLAFAVGRYTSVLSPGAGAQAASVEKLLTARGEATQQRPVRRLLPMAHQNDVDPADSQGVPRELAPTPPRGDAEQEDEEASRTPTPEFKTATEERDYFLERIQGTGSATGQSLELMRSVEREWNQMVREATSDLELGSWRCFQAGCTMTLRYRTQATAEPLLDQMMTSQAAALVSGERFLSGPVPASGGLTEMTWIFFFSPERGAVKDG